MNNATHHWIILFANFSIDRGRRCVTELTPGAGARRERIRASVNSDNLRARRFSARVSFAMPLTISTILTVTATTLKTLLRVVAFLFGDQVHVVATLTHSRANQAVVQRRPSYLPLL